MRIILPFFCLFFSIMLICAPESVYSQVQEDSEAYTLGEIVVSAEKEGVESIGTVREITSEDIQTKEARTLDEALELLPGVNIRTGADGTPRVDLRGFRSRHVILLLDGIPLNSTYDGQFDPSIIPVENIAKIKIAYGDHSVLYGDGGLGGIINIITKKGKKGVHGTVSSEIGVGDRYLGQFSLSGGHEKVDFFLSGSLSDANGFRLSDDFRSTNEEDGGLRENSDERRNNLFANVNYMLNNKLIVGAVFNYSKGEFGIPPSTIDDPGDPFADKSKYERVDDFEGYSAHLSLGYDVFGPLGIRTWFFINQMDEERNRYDDSNYDSMDDPKVKGTYHEDSKTSVKGIGVQTKYDLKSAGLFTLGLNARWEGFENDGIIRDVKVSGGNYDIRSFQDKKDLKIYSAALEYEISPIKKSLFVIGYSHNWLEKDGGKDDNEGSFLAGARYDISENTRIKGSCAKKIRFPSIRQLYEEGSGNPDLLTEESYNYELGVEQRLPWDSMITLTGFIIDVKDYIEKDSDDVFQNNEKYRFQGFEVTAGTRYIKNLFLKAGYTYLDTEDKSPGSEKDELQYRPRHKLTLESKYSFMSGFSTYMNIMYIADQVYYSKDTPVIKEKLNDYILINLKMDKVLLKGLLRFYVGVDNLFDADYEESYGYPQAGRFIYGGVTVTL